MTTLNGCGQSSASDTSADVVKNCRMSHRQLELKRVLFNHALYCQPMDLSVGALAHKTRIANQTSSHRAPGSAHLFVDMGSSMLRKVLFNIHWFVGITVGIALAIMGFTGALLSFEEEILQGLNGSPAHVESGTARLSLSEMVARAQAAAPDKSLSSLTIHEDPEEAVEVQYARAGGDRPLPGAVQDQTYLNPYTGEVETVTLTRGAAFMGLVERLHRRLRWWETFQAGSPGAAPASGPMGGMGAMPEGERPARPEGAPGAAPAGVPGAEGAPGPGAGGMGGGPGGERGFDFGEQATSYAVLFLLIMALSGLYLRWPRRNAAKLSSWFKINFKLKGYAFNYNLHAVIGTVVLVGYLMSAHSGLMMSEIGWYKSAVNSLAGVQGGAGGPGGMGAGGPGGFGGGQPNNTVYQWDQLWQSFEREVPSFAAATVQIGSSNAEELRFSYLLSEKVTKEGGRNTNALVLDAASGAVRSHELFSAKTAGERFVQRNFDFHSGGFFGTPGRIFILLTSLMMPVLLVTGWMQYLARRKQKKQRAAALKAKAAAG